MFRQGQVAAKLCCSEKMWKGNVTGDSNGPLAGGVRKTEKKDYREEHGPYKKVNLCPIEDSGYGKK